MFLKQKEKPGLRLTHIRAVKTHSYIRARLRFRARREAEPYSGFVLRCLHLKGIRVTVPVCALCLFGLALLTQHGRKPRELCCTLPIQRVVSTMIQDGASSLPGGGNCPGDASTFSSMTASHGPVLKVVWLTAESMDSLFIESVV